MLELARGGDGTGGGGGGCGCGDGGGGGDARLGGFIISSIAGGLYTHWACVLDVVKCSSGRGAIPSLPG